MNGKVIKTSEIQVNKRYRDDLGDVESLVDSIKESGLVQPLAVQYNDDTYTLLAGERRLTALKELGHEKVLVRIYEGELTELDRLLIENAENYHRKDLEYHEQCRLTRRMHELHVEKYGEKISTSPDAPGHSLTDTAEIAGVSKSTVRTEIAIANAIDVFPELFDRCKTKSDASKVINMLEEQVVREELARRIEEEAPSDESSFDVLSKAFIINDFFKGVKDVPDSSVNIVEIDPPYAIDLKKKKKDYIYGDSYNEIDKKEYITFLRRTFKECYRVMSQHSWLLCWFAPEPWFEKVYLELRKSGFSVHRMCGIWTKPSGQNMQPQSNLTNCYEMFFYARKGSPAIAKQGRSNLFDFAPIQNKSHPTERPVEMMKEILETFAFEGSTVMVPFLGSGNTLIAAHELRMKPFGFELSKQYRDSFLVRIYKG
jgi:ParB/RepB/Spo0J family partition protein